MPNRTSRPVRERVAHSGPPTHDFPRSGWAQAYCGGAHGTMWQVADPASPPYVVELACADGWTPYRLLWNPKTGRPVRNDGGAFVYLPVISSRARSDAARRSGVVPLPQPRGGHAS